jgi:hypothetical protein
VVLVVLAGIFGATGGAKTPSFAGVFGNGGMIPSGSFGVVGERGPELVSGPAMVTPQAALSQPVNNTYVTNNISAVDAAGVAALFMNNRKMLLGATETARKELPGRLR